MPRCAGVFATLLALLAPFGVTAQDRFAEYEQLVDRYRAGRRHEAVRALADWTAPALVPIVKEVVRRPWPKAGAAALLHTDRALLERELGNTSEWERQLRLAARLVRTVPNTGATRGFRPRWFVLMALMADAPRAALPWVREGLDDDPGDPGLLLQLATIEETLATFGRGRQHARMPAREDGIGLAEAKAHTLELEGVKRDLRRALKAEPDLHEARLRLARMLKYMHEVSGAQAELEQVLSHAQDERLLYLAQLMSGEIHEEQGRTAEAEAAYTAATALEPRCQTGFIALSHARWLRGDLAGAADARQKALAHGESASGYADPWWRYPHGNSGERDLRLDELRQEASR